jgi:non-specific serine/threonine protein kinase
MLTPGTKLFHYHVIAEIGHGAMSRVYKALDTKLNREVAIKCFNPSLDLDDTGKQRFMQEAQAISQLDHENVCTVFEINEAEDGNIFMAMSYYPGGTLQDRMNRQMIDTSEAIRIACEIVRGLVHAHQHGVVHRDIKPVNIMFSKNDKVKIVDFGIAKCLDQPALTSPGTVLGTIAYMSPEQAEGDPVDHQTDLWALAVVLYEMLTKRKPFYGDTEEQYYDSIIMEEPLPIRDAWSGVPDDIAAFMERGLAKDKAYRFQTAVEMQQALESIKLGG